MREAALPFELALIKQAQDARYGGATIHDMPSTITTLLVSQGLYTTTEPRNPGSFKEFRRDMAQVRTLGRIASNVQESMGVLPEYAPYVATGKLGSYLADVFGGITAITAEDVDIVDHQYDDRGQLVDGRVVAGSMTFGVPSLDAGTQLNDVLQVLLRAPNYTYRVRKLVEQEQHRVQVLDIDEHVVRSLGRAVGTLVAEEDRGNEVELPPDKRTVEFWRKRGETFPPFIETRLAFKASLYKPLEENLDATYVGEPELRPATEQGLLGTDAAAAFQGMRGIFNALIRAKLPAGSARNLEQDPDPSRRLTIEEGVELRREPFTSTDLEEGPPAARTLYAFETLRDAGARALADTRRHPLTTSAKFASKLFGAGIESLADLTILIAPKAKNKTTETLRDYKEWRRRKAHIEATGRRIDTILQDAIILKVIQEERRQHFGE